MNRLLQFLFKYRTLLVFIVLEGICFFVIVKSNSYHSATYFTSSNQVAASLYKTSSSVTNYFSLLERNNELIAENAMLRQQLLDFGDTSTLPLITAVTDTLDSSMVTQTPALHARVIDNSVFFRNNYLTIDRGLADGVKERMGVISSNGIVGQVKYVSEHYATVVSLLHGRAMISAKHGLSNGLCTISWSGEDPEYADIEYFPRHIALNVGDSIVTSGYNSIFPEGELIGTVSEVHLEDQATFYDAQIKLATDFYRLKHVYLLSLPDKMEIDSLIQITTREDG
ncbi:MULTISPECIES: rod shape-determining protein MreC [Reichenbachiella]|uniref:Cell shape-determining protein MreC n=1 Tax=Reichenbachiella agariperforans TaxID=156994 RepID=A0A1M6TUL3_REIAG|nr:MULTISPECIES: rod shape-determining protein MreC [Reichenbachiella]MBU2915583.1 rod shape-determining protein MreC [Reichenbachiella agariperforans]RJE71355.1 rod shape-determining protein MreC [Reichenbachiella sp. MSK19-1]SHK60647.1 rod shape-determining protein MreC [Reichenbachiella agariperforans]